MNKNMIGRVKAKHGTFYFCNYDEFIGLAIREYGEYSELELKTILKFIKEGDTVFDIGANIGCFSVPLAKKVGSTGKIFACEPQPFINKLLRKNIQANNLNNIKVINEGLGAKREILNLDDFDYSTVGNFGGISFSGRNNQKYMKKKTNKKHSIKFTNLDEFLDIDQCNFLKIDVELMELNVLKGAKNFIKKFRPIIWIENHREYPNLLNKYLLNIDYKPFWATTMLYNPNNYFVNDNNYYVNSATINTLAIPKEKDTTFLEYDWFNEIDDEYTQPLNALTK